MKNSNQTKAARARWSDPAYRKSKSSNRTAARIWLSNTDVRRLLDALGWIRSLRLFHAEPLR